MFVACMYVLHVDLYGSRDHQDKSLQYQLSQSLAPQLQRVASCRGEQPPQGRNITDDSAF